DDQHIVGVAEVDDVARNAEAGDEHPRAGLDDEPHLGGHVAAGRGQQVDAERLVGEFLDRAHLGDHLVGRHGRRAEAAEATGLRHGGDQVAVGDTAHPGEHDRVFDAEHVGETGTHGRYLLESVRSLYRVRLMDASRTPVIAAVAQTLERGPLVDNLDLAERVAADVLGPGLASRIQRLTAVGALLAPAGHRPATELVARLRIDPAVREMTTSGGHTPQWLVTRAAADIAAGVLDATLIVGAEAARSHRAQGRGGVTPFNAGRVDRDAPDADPVVGSPDRGFLSRAEASVG